MVWSIIKHNIKSKLVRAKTCEIQKMLTQRKIKSTRNPKIYKDIDTHWVKKHGERHYGYKNHVKADKKTKLIETYHTTDDSVHDFNIIKPLSKYPILAAFAGCLRFMDLSLVIRI